MQPVLTQVPPKSLRSIKPTDIPAAVSRPAKGGPAWPAPIMRASWVFVMKELLRSIKSRSRQRRRSSPSEIENDVALRPRTADKHVAGRRREERIRLVGDRPRHKPSFAGVTDSRAASPS